MTEQEKKQKISQELKRKLSLEYGGIFAEEPQNMVPGQSFLIVGLGGTGGDALEEVRENLKRFVDPDDLKERVRFLVIDSDKTTQYYPGSYQEDAVGNITGGEKRFPQAEFFWLDPSPAKTAIKGYQNDPGLQSWINAELVKSINANAVYLNGNGASATREIGRLLLYPAEVFHNLDSKVQGLVNAVTAGNANQLRILIISGISGGTGSGTVVDATYMIRHIVSRMPTLAKRFDINGFVLLPPTGNSSDANVIKNGNRNGVAAMKEIDHFMTIAQREEEYAVSFGGQKIVSPDNLFTACYLIDGIFTSYKPGEPREKAFEVLADCVLDMVATQPVAEGGKTVQVAEALMSDATTFTRQMLIRNPADIAPRSANYIYRGIGHAKTLIPLRLIKSFVASKAFDRVYADFRKHANVTEDAAERFIRDVETRPFNQAAQRNNVMRVSGAIFEDPNKGPYYTIELMRKVGRLANSKAIEAGRSLFRKKDEPMYRCIEEAARALNNELFEVYTFVLDEMKSYLNDEGTIISRSERIDSYTGSTYTFMPLDWSRGDAAQNAVYQYLQGLINPGSIKQLTNDLVQEMKNNREAWTQLVGRDGKDAKFDAARRIREFWKTEINKIVDATLEEYLVRFYSDNSNTNWSLPKDAVIVPGSPEDLALKAAAKAIVGQMWGTSGTADALLEMRSGLIPPHEFYGKKFMFVPEDAPNLYNAIIAELTNTNNGDVQTAKTKLKDRLSCYSQFVGMPAFMLAWAERAEPDYERAIAGGDIGLHMSETAGGNRWRDFPNLLPEALWSRLRYSNDREKKLVDRAAQEFDRSLALGMAEQLTDANGAFQYFIMHLLPEEYRPDPLLYKDLDIQPAGSDRYTAAEKKLYADVEGKAAALFAKGPDWANQAEIPQNGMRTALTLTGTATEQEELKFADYTMTPGGNIPNDDAWTKSLAKQLLRNLPTDVYSVRGTNDVLECLYDMIHTAQREKAELAAFVQLLAADLFFFDNQNLAWKYQSGLKEVTLLSLRKKIKEQKLAEYYFLFQEYRKNFAQVNVALRGTYYGLATDPVPKLEIEKQDKLAARAAEIQAAVQKAYTPDRKRPDQENILTSTQYEEAVKEFSEPYDVDAIVKLYQSMDKALKDGVFRMNIGKDGLI